MEMTEIEGPGELWDRVYAELLAPSFPPAELGDRAVLASLLTSGAARATAVTGGGGAPLAVAYGEWSPGTRVQLLAYLAVAAGLRGTGIGGGLLREVLADWRRRYTPCAILAEIEHPLAHDPDDAYGDPAARLRFYARHGAAALDLPYFQPALSPETDRCHGMLLIALHIDDELKGTAPGSIAAGPVAAFLTEYFESTEGMPQPGDRAAEALFAAVRRPRGIPLLPLEHVEGLPVSRP